MARRLNLDFVNLGFGGAGKAEPDVVALVNQLDASCFIFDLGKSYGNQTREPFARMLATIRAAHPTVPIICVTPIYSTKEIAEAEYREKSVRLRNLMREAAVERRESGDALTFVVEGLELFGPADQALFRDPQHPNDEGNELMAARLVPMLEQIVLPRK
jgi:lysophospholipase L1-like esterase